MATKAQLRKMAAEAVDLGEGLSVQITDADQRAVLALAEDGKLAPGERPSERLFSIALSRQLGRKVKVHFSEDNRETYVEYLDGH